MNENGHNRHYFEFVDFRLYPEERLLLKSGKRVPLTPRVLDLLHFLVTHHGELVGKEAILESVWADAIVEEGNINRTVSTLRQSLGAQPNGNDFIETVPKIGYRFIAPVQEIAVSEHEDKPTGRSEASRRFWLRAAVGLLLFVVAGGVSYYLFVRDPSPVSKNGFTNLTNNVGEDDVPVISPNGKEIVFSSNRHGPRNIYLMNVDGSNVRRLTNSKGDDHFPSWSPDGTRIVFESSRDGEFEIYVMNSDGTGQARLTFNPTGDGGPARFSPDGTKIAFARDSSSDKQPNTSYNIHIMNADGTNIKQLTDDPGYDAGPIWSPDGTRIAFAGMREKSLDAFVMNSDGSGQTNLTNTPENESPTGWSSDGHRIIFNRRNDVKADIWDVWSMSSDGSNAHRITNYEVKSNNIIFCPTIGKYLFSGLMDGNSEIYLVDALSTPHQ